MSKVVDLNSPIFLEKQAREPGCFFNSGFLQHRYRYFILILGLVCLSSISSNMVAFNFAIICMRKPVFHEVLPQFNFTSTIVKRDVSAEMFMPSTLAGDGEKYTQDEKSTLLWAAAFGSIFATFPYIKLYGKYGARYVFFSAGILSSIATAFIPLCASYGMIPFCAVRFIQGMAYSANFACIGMICSRFASLKQHAFFLSSLTIFSQTSLIFTNPVSAYLCESRFGWQSVYYVHAIVCPLIFFVWLFAYSDFPERHPYVSAEEVEKIHRGKTSAHIELHSFIPYSAILRNPIIWVVWLNAFADIVSGIFLLTYLPTYVTSVLKYDVKTAGFYSMLPALAVVPLKVGCGFISDRIKSMTERTKMIFFNSLAMCLPAVFFILVGLIPDEYPFLAVICNTLNYASTASNCAGTYKCGTLVARQYAHFVVANIQFIKCLTLFISPALVTIFVSDESSKQQWWHIFLIFAVVCLLSNALFCWYATDQPAEFTKILDPKIERKKLAEMERAEAGSKVTLHTTAST